VHRGWAVMALTSRIDEHEDHHRDPYR